MRLAIEPLTIPLGPTGIILDGVRAGFQLDPLILEGGVGLSAGPRIGSYAVLEADADLSLQIDPNFRFETVGSLRVLPTSANNQLARGDVSFILDCTGLIALRGNARFEATAAGVGISARIGGSGAYSTSASVFNIGASATGNLELGFLGSAQIAQLKAVVSSDGFGTCGKLFSFISAGVGQNWRRGGLKLMTSCNLGPYRVNVANASQARRMQAGVRSTPFTVPAGVDQVAVEVRGKQRGVAMRLFGPGDKLIANIPAGTRAVGNDLVAFSARDGVWPPTWCRARTTARARSPPTCSSASPRQVATPCARCPRARRSLRCAWRLTRCRRSRAVGRGGGAPLRRRRWPAHEGEGARPERHLRQRAVWP